MSDEKNIPGTRVPDTPIHRASMWVEDIKFGEGRPDAVEPVPMGDTWEEFIKATGLPITAEQLMEAASYYGSNNVRMLTGGRLDVVIPSPTGEGYIDLAAIFASLWADAFFHGVATAQGRTGLSNTESDQRVDRFAALAKWNIGEWSAARYLNYLEHQPDYDPDDPGQKVIIDRLRDAATQEK